MNKYSDATLSGAELGQMANTNYRMVLHVPDINGVDCQIDMFEFLKVIRSLAPEEMDKLWEKARK